MNNVNNNTNDSTSIGDIDNSNTQHSEPTSSRKFLPAWDIVKKSFDLFFDNVGLCLFFALWYIVIYALNFFVEMRSLQGSILGSAMTIIAVIGSLWLSYSLMNVFIRITKGIQQGIGDALKIDVARFLKMIIAYLILIIIYLAPTGIVALGLFVIPDITWIRLVYLIVFALTILGTMVFAIRYIFAPAIVIEENCSVFEAFPKSKQITKGSRTGLFLLLIIVTPIVSIIGLIGFFIGVFITAIVGYIIPVVAYRALRAQTMNEPDGTGIIQKTSYESSKKSNRILYGLCAVIIVGVVGVLSLIGFIALSNSTDEAEDAIRISELRSFQAALNISGTINNSTYPPSPELGKCSPIGNDLIEDLPITVLDAKVIAERYFYGAGINPETNEVQSFVIGTKIQKSSLPATSTRIESSDIDRAFGPGHGCECGDLGDDTIGYCVGFLNS